LVILQLRLKKQKRNSDGRTGVDLMLLCCASDCKKKSFPFEEAFLK
jgi:hypothetical protein